MITPKQLKDFEEEIASLYSEGFIRAPIHLRSGNFEQLIEIFKEVSKDDYWFGTWASHSSAILKGVPQEEVKKEILDGHSITLCWPQYKFYTSAIVGQIGPWATGAAHSIKLNGGSNRVYCLIGDAASHTGVIWDSVQFSIKNDLPLTWILENNNMSVCTPVEEICPSTKKCWDLYQELVKHHECKNVEFLYYEFESEYPHSGLGKFLSF